MFKNRDIILTIAVILHFQGLYCQEINKLNEKGNKQGVWKESIDDLPNIDYALISYEDGIRNGELKSYYKNGNIATYVIYKNNEIDSILKNYYLNGELKYLINYDKGEKDGLFMEFTKEGILKLEKKYCDGIICDFYKEYYDNGNLHISVKISYNKKGDKIEKWKVFYENGKLMSSGMKKNNKNIGVWKKFTEQGELIKNK